jgi:hypothetical protein
VDETCHVVWKVRVKEASAYLHAIGDGAAGNRVTSDMAEKRFHNGKCFSPWLPVLLSSPIRKCGKSDGLKMQE